MSNGQPDEPDHADEVGSVGAEAAKLLGALSDWAREHGSDVGEGLGGLAGHAAASVRDLDEHLATGAAECTYCPVCRTVHAVRRTSPEVRAHLAQAATSLLHAASGLLATVPPPGSGAGAARGREVERIDLDADEPETDR